MKRLFTRLVIALVPLGFIFTSSAEAAKPVKNIILFISDGCGYNHITATDYYQYGRQGTQVYEQFPVIVPMATFSASGHGYDGQAFWSDFDYGIGKGYATDSSAAVTAMATGEKTTDGRLNVAVDDITLLKIITEYAQEKAMSTGTISSVQFSHATPAGFGAHNIKRDNFVEIAQEMLLDSKLTVIMGAGHPLYNDDGGDVSPANPEDWQYVGGETVFYGIIKGESTIDENEVEDIDGDGNPDTWTIIQNKSEFKSLMKGPTPKRVFGLAKIGTTLQEKRSGGTALSMPFEIAFNKNVPTLEDMAGAALNILDNDPDGFFLHIEGGAVDWAGHDNKIGRLIEEETDFNNAVEAAVEWVKKHSTWDETLIIVTGDHETGYLHGPGSGTEPDLFNPIINNGRRRLPGFGFYSTSHSNSLVPLFAKGGFSDLFKTYATETDPVRGAYIDNTDVFKVCLTTLVQGDTNNQLFPAVYELIDIISDEAIQTGLKKSLINKVENAQFQLSKGNTHAAINQLEIFIKQIKAEQVKKNGIPFNQASQLIKKAQNIIDMLTGNEKRVVSLKKAAVTESYSLSQNIPNPFNSYTTIEFIIPSGKSEQVNLDIFDIRGVHVKTLADRVYGPGIHSVVWDGTNKAGIRVSSGIYLYNLQTGGFTKSNKMLLMK